VWTLDTSEALDGEDVIPNFAYPVASAFADLLS